MDTHSEDIDCANAVPLQVYHGQAAGLVAERDVLLAPRKACQHAFLALLPLFTFFS